MENRERGRQFAGRAFLLRHSFLESRSVGSLCQLYSAQNGSTIMNCPNCSMPMTDWKLAARMGNQFTIDVCPPCQAFWFNRHEELGLTSASTLQLMKYIGEHSSAPKPTFADRLKCPLCGSGLTLAHDMTRNEHFVYWKCPGEHGHFISFLDFLKRRTSSARFRFRKFRICVQAFRRCGAPAAAAPSTCRSTRRARIAMRRFPS